MTAGTFNLSVPEFEVATVSVRRAYSTPREGGFVQRRTVSERQVRFYTLRWPRGGIGEKALLETLWDSTSGGTLDLDYTTQDGETIRVFLNNYTATPRSAVLYDCECELEEVL